MNESVVWDSPGGPFVAGPDCAGCTHPQIVHSWSGRAFTFCTVWDPDRCDCTRWRP